MKFVLVRGEGADMKGLSLGQQTEEAAVPSPCLHCFPTVICQN